MLQRDTLRFCAAGAALFAFVVYLPRVAPTLTLMGDSAVFVSAGATWGVPQPSGYPLWTTIAFLWSKLLPGDVAHRIHLLSALLHALTVFVVGCTIGFLTESRLATLTGALWLAFSRAFFLGSLYTEVFPLNDLFTALALYAAFRKDLTLLAIVAGLASAHHQTIALLAPALAVLIGKSFRDVRRKHFALFLAPVVLFNGLILLAARRDPMASWGEVRTLRALIALITRSDYGGLFSPHRSTIQIDRTSLIVSWGEGILLAFTGWVLLAIAVGVWGAWRRNRVALASLLLAILFTGPIFAMLNRLDVDNEHGRAFAERFSTQSAVPIAILIGFGIAFAYAKLSEQFPATWLRVGLGLSAMIPLARHAADCDLRNNRRGLAVAHDTFHDIPDGSLVLLSGDAFNGAAFYVCSVERRCGRTIVFSPGQMHLEWRVTQLRRRHPDLVLPAPQGRFITTRELVAANIDRRPVFLSTRILQSEPGIREAFDFLPFGIMVRALRPEDVAAFKAGFPDRARALLAGQGFEGSAIKRADLVEPSLERELPFLYALAYENHARVLELIFGDADLAAAFTRKGDQTDPDAMREFR
jgi:hypothetical protein